MGNNHTFRTFWVNVSTNLVLTVYLIYGIMKRQRTNRKSETQSERSMLPDQGSVNEL